MEEIKNKERKQKKKKKEERSTLWLILKFLQSKYKKAYLIRTFLVLHTKVISITCHKFFSGAIAF